MTSGPVMILADVMISQYLGYQKMCWCLGMLRYLVISADALMLGFHDVWRCDI